MVVVFHANKLLPADKHILGHGALAVEFFCLLSGYLMMASVQRRLSDARPRAGVPARWGLLGLGVHAAVEGEEAGGCHPAADEGGYQQGQVDGALWRM